MNGFSILAFSGTGNHRKFLLLPMLMFLLGSFSCYREMEQMDWTVSGTVTDPSGNPVRNIRICALQHEYAQCTLSDIHGSFILYVPDNIRLEAYEVCAYDIDQGENGWYQNTCVTVPALTPSPWIEFVLEPLEK